MNKFSGFLAGVALIAAALLSPAANAQEQSTWDHIQEAKLIRVGCVNAEPWGFKDPNTGKWEGIVPGYADLIAKELGVKWECVETTWGTAIAGLQANQFDLVGGFDPTPQRALAVDFVPGALVYYAMAILARKDLKADNWSDLNNADVKAAVPLGTSSDTMLTKLLDKAQFVRTKGNPEAVAAFASGRGDFVAGSSVWLVMQNHALDNQGKIVVPKPVKAATAGVGVRREADKRWRDWLGVTLDYYYWKGSISDIYDAYLKSRGIEPSEAPGIRLQDLQ
jgi:polar amino acid transport system substrate-binding protein